MSDTTPNPPPDDGDNPSTAGAEPSSTGPTAAPPGQAQQSSEQAQQPPGQAGPPPGQYAGYGPPAGEYGYGGPPAGAGQPGELGQRFLARLVDGILLGIITTIIDIPLGVSALVVGSTGAHYAANAVGGIIGAVIYVGYFAVMESRNGQTLGKMLLKLRTEGPNGGPPDLTQAALRSFWGGLGILAIVPVVGATIGGLAELVIIIVIAVTISQSPQREGWHDRLAGGTKVVKSA